MNFLKTRCIIPRGNTDLYFKRLFTDEYEYHIEYTYVLKGLPNPVKGTTHNADMHRILAFKGQILENITWAVFNSS